MTKTEPVSKPFAGYEDHDACVRDNTDKEDPDAFCAWLADEAKDALSDPNAEKVLTSLVTEFVSSVGEPAQASEWVIMKDAGADRRKAEQVERPYVFAEPEDVAAKAADVDVRADNAEGERQIAYAAVLIPNEVDKQGDVIPPYVVERAAHEYMAEYRKMDSDHDLEDGAGVPVESWILKDDTEFDLPDGGTVEYPAGTWVIGKRFVDDEWARVKAGELTGFSIYGSAQPIDVDDLADEVKAANRAKGASGSAESNHDMKNALIAATKSETPTATLADRIQAAKAELPDEDAEMVVEMLRAAAEVVEQATHPGEDEAEDGPEDDPDGDDDEVEDEATDKQEDSQSMTEDDTPEDGGTDEPNDDAGDAVADGIDELKSMVKGVDEKVDDFDDRLAEVEDEVETLKENVDVEDPAPGNDRMTEDDENDRLKSVAKEAANEALEAAGVAGGDDDPDDDREVARKGKVEQTPADEDVEKSGGGDLPQEDYSGIFGDDEPVEKAAAGTGARGNMRFSGGE